jgi:hypothetical protein
MHKQVDILKSSEGIEYFQNIPNPTQPKYMCTRLRDAQVRGSAT